MKFTKSKGKKRVKKVQRKTKVAIDLDNVKSNRPVTQKKYNLEDKKDAEYPFEQQALVKLPEDAPTHTGKMDIWSIPVRNEKQVKKERRRIKVKIVLNNKKYGRIMKLPMQSVSQVFDRPVTNVCKLEDKTDAEYPFEQQALVVLPEDAPRHAGKMDIWSIPVRNENNEAVEERRLPSSGTVYIVERNPYAQIYFCLTLHSSLHGTIPKSNIGKIQHMSDRAAAINIVKAKQSFFKDKNMVVLNSGPLAEDEHNDNHPFFPQIYRLMKEMAPGFENALTQKHKRRTLACNIGFTATDSSQYCKNRSTILDNISPFLIQTSHIQSSAMTALGKLAILSFKEIMPELGQQQHFRLDLDSDSGRERAKMRSILANTLNVGEDDMHAFRCEALSVIIPLSVMPHKDEQNDNQEGFCGTLTLNCSLPISILTNKRLINHLRSSGFTDKFPFSVVLYSRKVCRTFYNLRNSLSILSNTTFGRQVHEALINVSADNELNYIRLFDHAEIYERMIDKIKNSRSNEMDRHKRGCVEVPSTYEAMSKWSIIIDCALEFHCSVRPLRTRDIIQYVVFIMLCRNSSRISPLSIAAESMLELLRPRNKFHLPSRAADSNLYNMLLANVPEYERQTGAFYVDEKVISSAIATIFNWCKHKRASIKRMSGLNLRQLNVYEDFPYISIVKSSEMLQDLVRGLSLFGLLPLELMGSVCLEKKVDELSQNIECLTKETKLRKQRQLLERTFHFVRSEISTQVTRSFIGNIINIRSPSGSTEKDAYYHMRHKNRPQHFYRLKYDGHWQLKVLPSTLNIKKNGKKQPKAVTLTNWKEGAANEKGEFVCWEISKEIEKDSKLFVPPKFVKELYTPQEQELIHNKIN